MLLLYDYFKLRNLRDFRWLRFSCIRFITDYSETSVQIQSDPTLLRLQ